MLNPATTHFPSADAPWPDHTGGPFHPSDDLTLSTGTACFRPDDDRRDHPRICFHPGDDRRGNGGRCHHASDSVDDDRIRAAGGNTTTNYLRPADDGTSTKCFHALSYEAPHPCFRPADDEPVAIGTGRPVSPCHHPSEPGDHAGRPEDLAAGLHRTLTEFEQQHLDALSSRS